MKNDLSTSHIPVIILTAQATDDTHAACYEAGADGYLTKPFDIRVLTTRIDNLLLQYRQRSRQFLHAPDTDCDVLPYQNQGQDLSGKHGEDRRKPFHGQRLQSGLPRRRSQAVQINHEPQTQSHDRAYPDGFRKISVSGRLVSLLRQADMTVSEVACRRLQRPKYFAKCFKEENTAKNAQTVPKTGGHGNRA